MLAALQEEIRGQSFTNIKDLILATLDDETLSLKTKRDRLKAACQTSRDSLDTMQRLMADYKLGVLDIELKPPFEPLLEKLNNISRDIRMAHDQRLERRRVALETMTALTDELEELPPCTIPTGNVSGAGSLSLGTICDLESAVEEMQILSKERAKQAEAICNEINALKKLLGIQDETLRISSAGKLSQKRLTDLRIAKDHLEKETTRRRDEMNSLHMRRSNLRKMLDMDPVPLSSFLGQDEFDAVKQDLSLLENLKLQHMEKFVKKARKELISLGSRLFLTTEEITLPREDYTEEALVEHENAILCFSRELENPERQKISKYISEFLHIQEIEAELTELMKDPTRYNRRGKEMLSEQKKRDFVTRRKPAIVAMLSKLLNEWAMNHDQTILVFGKDIRNEIHELNAKLNHVRSNSRVVRPIPPPVANEQDRRSSSRLGKSVPIDQRESQSQSQSQNQDQKHIPSSTSSQVVTAAATDNAKSSSERKNRTRKSQALAAIKSAPARIKRALNPHPGISKDRRLSNSSKPIKVAPSENKNVSERPKGGKENVLSPGTAFQEWKRKKVPRDNPNDTYTLGPSFRYSTDGF